MTKPTRDLSLVSLILAAVLSVPLLGTLTATGTKDWGLNAQHLQHAEPLRAAAPGFVITDERGRPIVQDNSRANVRLWESMLLIEMTGKPQGEHLSNIPQEIGDCVSFADSNAATYLGAVQVAKNGGSVERVFPPYNYGALRVWIGKKQIRGDGGVVAWGVQAMQDPAIGLLCFDDPGVPPYSGSLAQTWGSKGPPEQFKAIARARRIRSSSPIESAPAARDAICNGYPVTFGHGPTRKGRGWGTRSCRVVDNRQVANWDDSWAHAQCIVGYDGSLGPGKEYFCVLNSHGENAHPRPLNGEPPGSYWVRWADMVRIMETADAWALSDLDGFPARDVIDWDQFAKRAAAPVGRSREMAL